MATTAEEAGISPRSRSQIVFMVTALALSVMSSMLNASMLGPAFRDINTHLGPNAYAEMSAYFYLAGFPACFVDLRRDRCCRGRGEPDPQTAPCGATRREIDRAPKRYRSTVHVDVMTVPQPLAQIGETARRIQASGFSGLLLTETGRTAYLNAAVAAQAAPGLELSTGVAVAFPRSPFVTAATAWELQEATNGKFRLGLGTQVRTHVVRRYGVQFERPGPRLRDYVHAVKACFAAFRTGTLEHHGEFYDLDFITPQWSPGAIEAPDPKVDIAAVNPWMLRMAGEVADGVHVHPLGEPGYLSRHVVPNIAAGADKSHRSASDLAVIVPVMTIVGDTDEERHNERELARASMSFYASTPNYAFILDEAGFEGTTARLREKQKAGDFQGMSTQITDDHLAAFATESTWDGLADALVDKYEGIATRVVLYNALADPERLERYGEVAQRISGR